MVKKYVYIDFCDSDVHGFWQTSVFCNKSCMGHHEDHMDDCCAANSVNRIGGMWTDLYSSSGIGNYWYCIAVLH